MPSSSRPYQSKILRFVLQQWQQGLERQDRAWRQLQSTATWGAQAVMFPLYAILRAVERANLALGSSSSHSDPETITATEDNTTDIDRSIATILTHTQQQLSPEQKEQLRIPPQSELIQHKRGWLSNVLERFWPQQPATHPPPDEVPAITKTASHSNQLTTSQTGKLATSQTNKLTTSQAGSISPTTSSGLLQTGHTLASMIENRHLVVVNSENEVSDIFTLEQQRELKTYIFRVITAYWQSRAGATRIPRRISAKTILSIGTASLNALPTELRKAWSELPSRPQQANLPPIGASPVPRSRIFPPKALSDAAPSSPENMHRLSNRAPDVVHANVQDSRYLEHPLEKILRWIDRILTWCERLWHG